MWKNERFVSVCRIGYRGVFLDSFVREKCTHWSVEDGRE